MEDKDEIIAPLCDHCKKIDLAKTNNREPAEYTLGTLKHMTQNAEKDGGCPFCGLVHSFLETCGLSGFHRTGEVTMEWKKEGGFFFYTDGDNLAFLNEETATSPYGSARAVPEAIDPDLIKKWINLCEVHHGKECTPKKNVIKTAENSVGVKVLRLIDTQDQFLVEAKPGDRYVGLSYVWGPIIPLVRLQKDTMEELSQKGAFTRLREKIPITIQDAIDLVQTIGERYLWVDSLCLVQDDRDDMLDGIAYMDLIYQCAVCTIVAAYGSDANAGLPGVNEGSRDVSQDIVEVLPGIRMTKTSGVYNAMTGAHTTRAWTLQELLLSYRALIFTEDRVYFRCRTTCWSEDTIYDKFPTDVNRVLSSGGEIGFLSDDDPSPLASYIFHLFRYTPRKITKVADTIHGFTGILRFLSVQATSGILEGLFTSSFDIGLLSWDNFPRATNSSARRTGFPSWSWAGWRGIKDGYARFCTDPDSVNAWLKTQTYIVWYRRSPATAEMALVWDLDSELKYGAPKADTIAYRVNANDPYGRNRPAFLDNLQTKPNTDNAEREEIIRSELQKRDYHFLHFFAFTILVQGFGSPPRSSDWAMVNAVLGTGGKKCGGVKFDNPKLMDKAKGPHELILLSKMDKYDGFFNDSITHERPFYWVMLIVWVSKDRVVAERRGIGFIYQDVMGHILPPGRVWKEIVLA